MKVFIICILFVLACNSNNKPTNVIKSKVDFFEDINMFELEGINKVDSLPNPPYIAIEVVDKTKKRITFHQSDRYSITREYTKQNGYWQTVYFEEKDTCMETIYEYLLPNKIIQLNFVKEEMSNELFLIEAIKLENSKLLSYQIPKFNIAPSVHIFDSVSKKANYLYTEQININDGILSATKKRTDMPQYESKTCYELGNHSFFYWYYFFLSCNQINCK